MDNAGEDVVAQPGQQRNPDNAGTTFLSVMAICAEEVFKWLSIDDLASLNVTCRQLKLQTGEYFQECYARKYLEVSNLNQQQFWPKKKSVYRFNAHYRNVGIMPGQASFNHMLQKHNQQVFSLLFRCGEILESDQETIAKIVKNVKIIELLDIQIDGELYECFLKYCTEMKHFIVKEDKELRECTQRGTRNKWQLQVYPKLEHVYWMTQSLPENLEIFFKQNPNVRTFHSGNFTINQIIDLFMRTGLCVDELHMDIGCHESFLNDIIPRLNIMYERRQYKRLMLDFVLYCNLWDLDWSNLDCLDGIYCLIGDEYTYETLLKLVMLKILILRSGETISPEQAAGISNRLINLEEVYLRACSSAQIAPFVRCARKMKKIYVYDLNRPLKSFDLIELNKERMKLKGANKVIVYLPDEAYIQLKWESRTLNHPLIEIKRSDSLNHEAPFVIDSLRVNRHY